LKINIKYFGLDDKTILKKIVPASIATLFLSAIRFIIEYKFAEKFS
jgi:hypothetical protein